MRKLILLCIILLTINFVSAKLCYQEASNIANQSGTDTQGCGLNYSGTYDGNYAAQFWDGNWDTYFTTSAGLAKGGNIWYVKPSGSYGATWKTKDGNAQVNLSVPIDCWSANITHLKFYVYGGDGNNNAAWYCYNTTTTKILRTTNTVPNKYEDAVIWNVSTVINISSITINMSQTLNTTPNFIGNISYIDYQHNYNITLYLNGNSYGTTIRTNISGLFNISSTALAAGQEYSWWFNATDQNDVTLTYITEKRIIYIRSATCGGTVSDTKTCQFSSATCIGLGCITGCV
jgi:hypothetical protein